MGELGRVTCQACGTRLRLEGEQDLAHDRARAVLLDTGDPGDGTGGLFIQMPYAVSMSAVAGPYCHADASRRLDRLNADARWRAALR